MDKLHPLSILMVIRSLKVSKDLFQPQKENKDLLGPEMSYLSAVGALMYIAKALRHDIFY